MFEGARRFAISAVIGGAVIASQDAAPVDAGGCYKDSVLPECSPIVVRVDRPRFSIQATDYLHNGTADIWVGSKTRQFLVFGDVTPDGKNEGISAVESACGANGDNSLDYTQYSGSTSKMVASISCVQQIP